jgi:hypothetical protein
MAPANSSLAYLMIVNAAIAFISSKDKSGA